jgi:hypothetical protein
MKRYLMATSLMVLFGALVVVAQDSVALADTATAVADSASAVIDTVVAKVEGVIEAGKEAKAAGGLAWYALGAAIINLLLALTKVKFISKLLNHEKMKPYKPLIAVVLGLLLGFFTDMATGKTIVECIYAGVMMGTSAVGLHEFTRAPGISKLLKYIN